MLFKLFLIFSVIPVIELAILIKVGSVIGTANTVAIIISTGVAGAFLARAQGFYVIRSIQTELGSGRMPSIQLLDAAFVLVGGVLLITPGIMTDSIGFIFLIPQTRNVIRDAVLKYIKKRVDFSGYKKDYYDV